jgi:hypothetical protein
MAVAILFVFGNSFLCCLNYVHLSALEADCPIGRGKQGVVSSYAHIGSGEEFRTALSDYNRAGRDLLAPEAFDASVLSVAVSSVP